MTNSKIKKTQGTKTLVTGIILLFATPVAYFVLGYLLSSTCPRTEYGSCSIDGGIQGAISLMIITAVWIIIALSVTIHGITSLSKQK